MRIAVALASLVVSYAFWHYIRSHSGSQKRADMLLVSTYAISRCGLWLLFALYLQHYVTDSDPRLFHKPMLDSLLVSQVPIRAFFYHYGPLLMPTILPFYVLCGRSLAGISLFAIFTEALALGFFLKSARLLEQRSKIDHSWVRDAMAIYLLNPATLYWTVLQGYHSMVQTAYSMAALYFLLCGRSTLGYGVGLYSLAGTKLLAILDWPALLVVRRPRLVTLVVGALPLLVTYSVFQWMTGDIVTHVHYATGAVSEGNVWFLLTLFGALPVLYTEFARRILPAACFGVFFLLGWVSWLQALRLGLTSFSFPAALGMTTFAMALFFLFGFYTGSYYVPMVMLPASLVVTRPTLRWQRVAVGSLLLSRWT
jgi:hypothetical protein